MGVTADSHTQCLHKAGDDTLFCCLCEAWVQEFHAAFLEAHAKHPTIEILWRALQRIRKLKTLSEPSAMWADSSLGVELGLYRARYPSSCVSETQTASQLVHLGGVGEELALENSVPASPSLGLVAQRRLRSKGASQPGTT